MNEDIYKKLGLCLSHIGINCENPDEAEKTANAYASLLGLDVKMGNSSIFAGKIIECMKRPYLGSKGHIAIQSDDIDLAVSELETQGFEFDKDTLKSDANGNTTSIYLKNEIGGFAVHFILKK